MTHHFKETRLESYVSILPDGEAISKAESQFLTTVISSRFDSHGKLGGVIGYLTPVPEENRMPVTGIPKGNYDLFVPGSIPKAALERIKLYVRGFLDATRGYEAYYRPSTSSSVHNNSH